MFLITGQSGKLAFVFEFAVLVKDPPLTGSVAIGKITDVFEPAVFFIEFTRAGSQTIAEVAFIFKPATLVIFFAAPDLEAIDKHPFRGQPIVNKALADQAIALIVANDVAVLARNSNQRRLVIGRAAGLDAGLGVCPGYLVDALGGLRDQ